MRRRGFLKFLGIVPFAPAIIEAIPAPAQRYWWAYSWLPDDGESIYVGAGHGFMRGDTLDVSGEVVRVTEVRQVNGRWELTTERGAS